MDPATVLWDRATAEWAYFVASVPDLAAQAALGLALLFGCAIVLTLLMPPRDYLATDPDMLASGRSTCLATISQSGPSTTVVTTGSVRPDSPARAPTSTPPS